MITRERGQITWTNKQVTELKKAVRNFNNKVRRLRRTEGELNYLPETVNYNELKEDIKTAAELRRRVNMLKRFSRRGAEKIADGTQELMTVWQKNEIIINKRVATRVLREEYNKVVKQNINTPFKDVTMVSSRAREIVSTLESLENVFKRSGKSFERVSARLKKLGRSDRAFLQASRYKQYYLRELEKYSNFAGYDEIVKKINSVPVLELYDKLGTNINLQDLNYVSDTTLSEEEFINYYSEIFNDEEEKEAEKSKVFFVYNENNIIENYFEDFGEAEYYVNKQKNSNKYKIREEDVNV